MKKIIVTSFAIAILLTAVPAFSQAREGFSLNLSPGAIIPLGGTAERYLIGVSAELTGDYHLPFAPVLFVRGTVGYALSTHILTQTGLSLVSFGGGLGAGFSPFRKFGIEAAAVAGYYQALFEGGSGGSLFFSGGIDLAFMLTPSFELGAGVSYINYVSLPDPAYEGLAVSLGARFRPGAGKRPKVFFDNIILNPVFPVFYKFYDTNPAGALMIGNGENGDIEDVRISFFVKQYMDNPKLCAVIPAMKKGEEKPVPIYALFTDRILDITEGTKVTADLIVEYSYLGETLTMTRSETLTVNNRNAMTWDDDRKAAAFVTPHDPAVLTFSKSVAGSVRKAGNRAVNLNFSIALGLFRALGLYGIGYVIDPRTPYTDFSANQFAVDFLQFPAQTLAYKAGDCDDLSILYSALLESVGIPAAFVTVPGHIYVAFALGMKPEEARKTFSSTGELIFFGDDTWIPVEITLLQKDFLTAWQTGASEWRRYEPEGSAKIFPISDAWRTYEPVGSPGREMTIIPPDADVLSTVYREEVERFARREISAQEGVIKERIRKEAANPKHVNSLGVLYARYGLYEDAAREFAKAAGMGYVPAMINQGSILYETRDFAGAEKAYARAESLDPTNAKAVLGLARVAFEREDYGRAGTFYARLREMDPDLAGRFSYLSMTSADPSRASSALEKEVLVWDEE